MKYFAVILFCLFSLNTIGQNQQWKYMGQTPPDSIPKVFAPDFISTKNLEHSSPTFSPDGKEVYWSVIRVVKDTVFQDIMVTEWNGNQWTKPRIASFSGNYYEGGPSFSADGNKMYIYNDKFVPPGGNANDIKICCLSKVANKWTNRTVIAKGFSPSFTRKGTVYYNGESGISRKIFKNEKYLEEEILNDKINLKGYKNWTPFVAPDESYLIFSRFNNNGDYGNLFISFRDTLTFEWSEPIHMGNQLNTWAQERFPSVSADGKYLFFTRSTPNHSQDVFWVRTNVIQKLEQEHKKQKEKIKNNK